ncbi:hypothetical protein IKQ38_04435 [Candidatus Saccharibacteria bacterium]|nr:hypothetical protein [Candidatus Saccharibacteria bacterium]
MSNKDVAKNNKQEKKNNTGSYIAIGVAIAIFVAVAVGATIYGLAHKDDGPEFYNCPTYDPHCMTVEKPMIYLYPTEDNTEISVKLSNPEKLTTSYPKYVDGWNVLAQKDGSLIDLKTNRELYGLYWEGANYPAKQTDEGFVVKGEESAEFLEIKLAELGLAEREAEEFIVYWLPKLEANKYNYIRFDTNETLDEYMKLEVSPKADTVIRIAMSYKGLDAPIEVTEQKIETPIRNGFTVVEWGGSEIK